MGIFPVLAQAQSYSSGKIARVRDAGLEIAAKGCAKPSNLKEEPVQTMKQGVTAIRRSFRCPNTEMTVIEYEGRVIPYTVAVSGDKTPVVEDVRTGMLAKDVKRMFGSPDRERTDIMLYNVPQGSGIDIVGFRHISGRVTGVEWQFRIDR